MEENPVLKLVEEHGGYWGGGHPKYLVNDWQHEVVDGNTRLGYWEWVFSRIEAEQETENEAEENANA